MKCTMVLNQSIIKKSLKKPSKIELRSIVSKAAFLSVKWMTFREKGKQLAITISVPTKLYYSSMFEYSNALSKNYHGISLSDDF